MRLLYPRDDPLGDNALGQIRNSVAGMILGDRQGMTIIGPATIVKEIKKDPNNIELLTTESGGRSRTLHRKPIKKGRR